MPKNAPSEFSPLASYRISSGLNQPHSDRPRSNASDQNWVEHERMANDGHLAILRQGVIVWNEWRDRNPAVIADLEGADLSGVDLSNVRWTPIVRQPEPLLKVYPCRSRGRLRSQ